MGRTPSLRSLYNALEEDTWRRTSPFSDDITTVNNVFYHPFATDADRSVVLQRWLLRFQPCLFGRIAAAGSMHYCFLSDQDLQRDDNSIANIIRGSLAQWKQRSLRPHPFFSSPAHGFMLVVASSRVGLARPDSRLLEFAQRLRSLWGCPTVATPHGSVNTETLYLEKPADRTITKFTFTVDFFGAQGDKRWWQDHRTPGGIAFTANSIGHMRRFREWYQDKGDQTDWVLQRAMETIAGAAKTPYGRATWLLPLVNESPVVERLKCPFKDPAKLKENIRGKDWTRYGGHLHTDHSIRSEFFHPSPEKPESVSQQQWLQDFAYLYDVTSPDHATFMAGEQVTSAEVENELGSPESFTSLTFDPSRLDSALPTELGHVPHDDVAALIARTDQWVVAGSID